jgi:predicted phage terminase large subunit-like protein
MLSSPTKPLSRSEAKEEKLRRVLRRSFRKFFTAYPPSTPYIYGPHTNFLIDRLQRAADELAEGRSTYIVVNVPFRHGKSDVISRRFGPWMMLRDPELETIIAAYGQDLANQFSLDARRVFNRVSGLYDLSLDRSQTRLDSWRLEGHKGAVHAVGLGGAVTGKGAAVLLIDDPHKNREDAESEAMRAKVWDGFASDLMTRLAPAHIVCVCANRWHIDDLSGRIIAKNTPGTDAYDPLFPRFEVVKFPAQSDTGEWLFPQRFAPEWYETQRATLGAYAWSAQGMQDPSPRTGNMLRADLVKIVDEMPADVRFTRGWDLASTEKERVKDDPDYTAGVKAGVRWVEEVRGGVTVKVPHVYIANARKKREAAVERDKWIVQTAKDDGPGVRQRVETVAGYKDAGNYLKSLLAGISTVDTITPHKDKVVRAGILEPIFGAGNVHILRADWNDAFLAEIALFPGGVHDDYVDALVGAVDDDLTKRLGETLLPHAEGFRTMGKEPYLTRPVGDNGEPKRGWNLNLRGYLPEFARAGTISRAAWYSRRGPSGCVWTHTDGRGNLTVIDAVVVEGMATVGRFAKEVQARSKVATGWHDYEVDVISGPQPELEKESKSPWQAILEGYEEAGKGELGCPTPDWVDDGELAGMAGLESLDEWMERSKGERMPFFMVWPKEVARQLEEARFKPDGKTGGETTEEAAAGGGVLVRCLRLLAVQWER